jgi:hypothetical protein
VAGFLPAVLQQVGEGVDWEDVKEMTVNDGGTTASKATSGRIIAGCYIVTPLVFSAKSVHFFVSVDAS